MTTDPSDSVGVKGVRHPRPLPDAETPYRNDLSTRRGFDNPLYGQGVGQTLPTPYER